VSFAPILKYSFLPLTDIIRDLLQMNKNAFGSDVEIEFAVNIPKDRTKSTEFYLLQVRPLLVGKETEEVKIEGHTGDKFICMSRHTIGNGIFQDIHDIIYVDKSSFEIGKTIQISSDIEMLNRQLYNEKRNCIIIGFGRVGTADPFLGIPLKWSQMSQAKVVVEADYDNLSVEPSLGSHFYHNLTSLKMGYLHIDSKYGKGEYIDWEWLDNMPVHSRTNNVKLIRSEKPFVVKINGKQRIGVILKP
jgi:hypothetical protein